MQNAKKSFIYGYKQNQIIISKRKICREKPQSKKNNAYLVVFLATGVATEISRNAFLGNSPKFQPTPLLFPFWFLLLLRVNKDNISAFN